jgi:adenylyltransferase/sulfurtransferase
MAEVTLRLPTPLQPYAAGRETISARAARVEELLDRVADEHAALVQRIRTRDGALRPYVNVFVRRTDIRELDGLATELCDGDEVIVVPSVAGG